MLKFIARHWRGEANFWLSVVVFSIVLPLGVIVLGSKWVGHTLQDTPQWRMIQAAVFFAYLAGRHMARRRQRQDAVARERSLASMPSAAILRTPSKWAIEHMRAAGLTEDFIERSFEAPADSLWYPTYDELREANVITEIVE